MEKRVVLKLDGNFDKGFRVTLEICSGGDLELEVVGELPPNPDLATCVQDHWENKYRSIGAPYRLKPEEIRYDGCVNSRIQDCRESAMELVDRLRTWLDAPGFRTIDRRFRDELSLDEPVQVLIRTNDPKLQKLPWHWWDSIEARSAEVALSFPEFKKLPPPPRDGDKVRILAILGHSAGIETDADRQILEELPDAEVVFLVEPKHQDIDDRLWEQSWDIIFFAGHSQTEGDRGRIYLNPTDSLTVDELWYGLQQAVKKGLKLAIFNSCDGLGLAKQLSDLQIPQMVVMRELVSDRVAQRFLKYFLKAFAGGKSFYLAVREARERLQGLEDDFPCASWLPVIFQHPAEVPLTWEWLLKRERDKTPDPEPIPELKGPRWQKLLLASVTISCMVMGVRSLGLLQSWELQSFDRLVRLQPEEPPDPRMTIVTVTEADIQGQDANERRGSLSDTSLEQLLQKLNQHQARVIGLDIYRPFPVQPKGRPLEKLLRQNERTLFVCEVGGGEQNPPIPAPKEVSPEHWVFSDLPIDFDGIVRRQFFGMSPNAKCNTDKSLSFQIANRYLAAEGVEFKRTSPNSFRIGTVEFKRVQPQTGGYNNVDAGGYQVLLNYRSAQAPARTVTLGDILNDRFDPSWIRDKIILIGTTARSIEDGLLTPHSARYAPIAHIPGVFVQGQMVSQIVSAVKDNRPLLWVLPVWGEVFCIWIGAVAGELLFSFCLRRRLSWPMGVAAGTAALGLWGAVSFVALTQGAWLPLVPSGLAFILAGLRAIGVSEGLYGFRSHRSYIGSGHMPLAPKNGGSKVSLPKSYEISDARFQVKDVRRSVASPKSTQNQSGQFE